MASVSTSGVVNKVAEGGYRQNTACAQTSTLLYSEQLPSCSINSRNCF